MKKRTSASLVIVVSVLLGAYVCTYISLSVRGRYEPGTIGLGGVKHYEWAPLGFFSEMQWRNSAMLCFLPCYIADTRLWHTSDRAHSGQYPITEVSPDDIGRYYEAWGASE